MTSIAMPLRDVTLLRLSTANRQYSAKELTPIQAYVPAQSYSAAKPEVATIRVRRNDPYGWEWRVAQPAMVPVIVAPLMPVVTMPALQQPQPMIASQLSSPMIVTAVTEEPSSPAPTFSSGTPVCNALVQFKCHHGEFSSDFEVRKGQYVVVQGDRGMDIGVVIRINTDECQQYVERTGASGPILRYATQREVDYWATDLKADEAAALEYCRQRVLKHRLLMDVRHAEYQFDKKKLTFYYEAKTRVDFVTLLKELFREFSCRIWMEKVRTHE
jgi:hypothetical protein